MHLHDPPSNYVLPDSPVHRLPAGMKVASALALIIGTVLIPWKFVGWLVAPLIVVLVVIVLSRIPLMRLLKRVILLEPFALGVAVLSLFQPGGWRIFLLVMAKCTICFVTTILLSWTTPVSEMIRVLRAVRVPTLLITTMLLMHRYLFVLMDETQRMRRARASRTFVKRRGFEWKMLSTVLGQLFIRSMDRADRVYAAMCARGWR
jgi:cobalt/nickel transport system permease protein